MSTDLDNCIVYLKKMIKSYPECHSFKDALLDAESKKPVLDKNINSFIKLCCVSFNTVEEALSKAEKGNYIIFVQGTYTIFQTYEKLNEYIDHGSYHNLFETIPHFQIIPESDTRKLIFIYENIDFEKVKDDLISLKELVLKHFNTLKPDDVIFLEPHTQLENITVVVNTKEDTRPKNNENRNVALKLTDLELFTNTIKNLITNQTEKINQVPIIINIQNNIQNNIIEKDSSIEDNDNKWIDANPPHKDEILSKYYNRATNANINTAFKKFNSLVQAKGYTKRLTRNGSIWIKH